MAADERAMEAGRVEGVGREDMDGVGAALPPRGSLVDLEVRVSGVGASLRLMTVEGVGWPARGVGCARAEGVWERAGGAVADGPERER